MTAYAPNGIFVSGAGGGGGAPSGPAGGVLGGTYPDPSFSAQVASDLADLTDLAAGAVQESDYDANTILKADSDDTPVALTMAASTILARLATGSIVAATTAQLRTLLGIADGDGWVDDSANTWTRTGNQTFTVSGDRTAVFTKGTRLRWTQTTVKYGVVIGSSHAAGTTTVTIAANNDYTLTAAAISVNSYSYAASPQGYPTWFGYTPTYGGFSANPAAGTARYAILGSMITFVHALNTGTSNATTFTMTSPVAAALSGSYTVGRAYNSGAFQAAAGVVGTTAASATLDILRDGAGAAWTNSGAKTMGFSVTFEY